MTYYELVKLNAPFLRVLKRNGVLMEDTEAIAIYEEYCAMEAEGLKKLFIRESLSKKYGVSTRSIYDIRHRFESPVEI